jgi:serine/threonine-protein kinase
MEEIISLAEFLRKAVREENISPAQKHFFLLQYHKGKMDRLEIEEEVASRPRSKREPVVYGGYILKSCLGKGGMGEVFEAYHRETGVRYALKKIRTTYGSTTEIQEQNRKRFMRECSLQAKLEHPHIVRVYDYGTSDKDMYLVTEYIDGETLLHYVECQMLISPAYHRQDLPLLVAQMAHICEALQVAHREGIIHRDINPKNILVDINKKAWIMDFGLAKPLGPEVTKVTKSTEVVGTPSYMSPEQWTNTNIGPASDIYSLGATLYFMATGQHPQPEDPMQAAYNVINQIPPLPVEMHNNSISETLCVIIAKAMSYELAERYSDMNMLGQALEEWLRQWQRRSLSRRIYKVCVDVLDSLKGKEGQEGQKS